MDREQLERLGRLNKYQIAGIAVVTSTFAAVAVLLGLRRFLFSPGTAKRNEFPDGAREGESSVPNHFTESLTVPGFTHTGVDIATQAETEGRSPEGV
jgi:hypothetical protein